MTGKPAPRFVCDEMLGRLARDLRLLGYDAHYAENVKDDTAVAALARERGAILLTRDVELARRVPGSLLLTTKDTREQVEQVLRGLGLTPDPALALSRCSVCNVPLVDARPEEVAGVVPEAVRERHAAFWRCPECRRVYWPGTHVERMRSDWQSRGGEQ